MDWTIVASSAITGAVGIAGVAGTILAARIAGNSARESVRLSVVAEDDRARLAEKRRIYARAIAALDAALVAVESERDAGHDPNAAVLAASAAISELALIAPAGIRDQAALAMNCVHGYRRREQDGGTVVAARNALLIDMRADLDEEAKRGG